MNWYKRHLGDIAAACAHLSQGAMGAYDLLLDWCYANERPLPKHRDDRYRIARAFTKAERENVDRVVDQFFLEGPEGFTQKRVQEEIARYTNQCLINREIGKRGGRPKRSTPVSEQTDSITQSVTDSVTELASDPKANCNPSQNPESEKPLDRHTTTDRSRGAIRSAAWSGTPQGEAAAALTKTGLRITSLDPNLVAACNEGVTVEALLEVQRTYPDKPAGYVIATARRINAEAKAPRSPPKDRLTTLRSPRVADDFQEKVYAGTRVEDLPPHLRGAAERAMAEG